MNLHEEFRVTWQPKAQAWEIASCDLYGRWRHIVSTDLDLVDVDDDGDPDDEDCELQALRLHRRGGLSESQAALVEDYTFAGRFVDEEREALRGFLPELFKRVYQTEWVDEVRRFMMPPLKFTGIDFGQVEDKVVMIHPRSGVALMLEEEQRRAERGHLAVDLLNCGFSPADVAELLPLPDGLKRRVGG